MDKLQEYVEQVGNLNCADFRLRATPAEWEGNLQKTNSLFLDLHPLLTERPSPETQLVMAMIAGTSCFFQALKSVRCLAEALPRKS